MKQYLEFADRQAASEAVTAIIGYTGTDERTGQLYSEAEMVRQLFPTTSARQSELSELSEEVAALREQNAAQVEMLKSKAHMWADEQKLLCGRVEEEQAKHALMKAECERLLEERDKYRMRHAELLKLHQDRCEQYEASRQRALEQRADLVAALKTLAEQL